MTDAKPAATPPLRFWLWAGRFALFAGLLGGSLAVCLWQIGVPLDGRALVWLGHQSAGSLTLLLFFMAVLMAIVGVFLALVVPVLWELARREVFPIWLPLNRIRPPDRGPPDNWPSR